MVNRNILHCRSLVKAVLSIFSGPLIESTFNVMDDIIEDDRSRLTVKNYEALAFIKSTMSVFQKTATSLEITGKMQNSVARSYQSYQSYLASTTSSQSDSHPKKNPTTLSTSNNKPPTTEQKLPSKESHPSISYPLLDKQSTKASDVSHKDQTHSTTSSCSSALQQTTQSGNNKRKQQAVLLNFFPKNSN